MRVGGLFSGVGGFELGLRRAGHRIVWHAETDWHCRRVLEHHFPEAKLYGDVRYLTAADVEPVEILCGGFPCQDISLTGRTHAGLDGTRSGLWREFARLIGELRPRYALVENVSALRHRGLDRILADLAALRYDAEWDCIRAADVGAPHPRDRLWLVAYPHAGTERREAGAPPSRGRPDADRVRAPLADADGVGCSRRPRVFGAPGWGQPTDGGWWSAEPGMGRVAHGIPDRVERLAALGNALVPMIAQQIGQVLE